MNTITERWRAHLTPEEAAQMARLDDDIDALERAIRRMLIERAVIRNRGHTRRWRADQQRDAA